MPRTRAQRTPRLLEEPPVARRLLLRRYLSESGADAAEETAIITTSATSSEGFAVLHVYMCASLLVRWSADLQQMDFQELVMFLQHLPTSGWSSTDVGELLSQAFVYRSLYHNAPSHLKQTSSGVPT